VLRRAPLLRLRRLGLRRHALDGRCGEARGDRQRAPGLLAELRIADAAQRQQFAQRRPGDEKQCMQQDRKRHGDP